MNTANAVLLSVCTTVLVAMTGCAKHADFVEMREEVGRLARAQDQVHTREEAVQRRLLALEGKVTGKPAGELAKDSEALHQRIQELNARLKDLEGKLARLEEGGRGPEVDSRQSKPARLPSTPEHAPMIPGTPDLTPTSAFNLAYNDYLNGRYSLAISGFQRFLKDYGNSSLSPNAHYWIGESYYSTKDYVRAIQALDQVVTHYPRSEKVAPALFKLGLSAAETGDAARARSYLKRVIEEFPSSDEAKLAKNKLTEIR
jgi:tol-pal system protein YbgF